MADKEAQVLVQTLAQGNSSTGHLTQFRVESESTVLMPVLSAVASVLQDPACRLSRLDLRSSSAPGGSSILTIQSNTLLHALAANTSITDLGVGISSAADLKLILLDPQATYFQRLLILRLRYSWWSPQYVINDAAEIKLDQVLAEALMSPNCCLRFLDLVIRKFGVPERDSKQVLGSTFWQSLQRNNASNKENPLQALRFGDPSDMQIAGGGLADYLCSPHCSLLWLDCRALYSHQDRSTLFDSSKEWELAESLVHNFSMCTLTLPQWKNPAAKAKAMFVIRRNSLYKSGQLLQEPQVKPSAAKVFLCGHGEAGKTTLCRALLSPISVVSSIPAYWRLLHKPISRTRGMELHPLLFQEGRLKLVICDLAGQEEFHTFHHYFMNASNNDLFVVVCKLLHEPYHSQEAFERELRYWLKFIVSHKRASSGTTITSIKPKVMVVVNFFYAASPEDMSSIACDKAQKIMTNFSRELDFSSRSNLVDMRNTPIEGHHFSNLFGIAVNKVAQVQVVKKRLRALLEEQLAESGRLIPKLCSDIVEKVLPSLRHENHAVSCFSSMPQISRSKPTMFLPLATISQKYYEIFPDANTPGSGIIAAMMELHNQGELFFFPKEGKSSGNDHIAIAMRNTLVILDNGWFCHKFIGDLLAVHLEQRASSCTSSVKDLSVWRIEDIKDLLRKQGCKDEWQLEEMVRYLQGLELCFVLEESTTHAQASHHKKMLLFPALVKQKEVVYPKLVPNSLYHIGEGLSDSHKHEAFFGRRLKCEETSVHLIPSGVFSRLQVRLRTLCDSYKCYKLGYCWASFMKGNIGAVVRFGGDATEPWENKEWIDILVFYPTISSRDVDQLQGFERSHNFESLTAAENLMTQIKNLIYEMCQSIDCSGIPTVVLQEWVLNSRGTRPYAVEFSLLREQMKNQGLEGCYVNWGDLNIPPTPIVELLLPAELEEHVISRQFTPLASITAEFYLSINDHESPENLHCKEHGDDIVEHANNVVPPAQPQDDGAGIVAYESPLESLFRRILKEELESYDLRQELRYQTLNSQMHDINVNVQMLRTDIHALAKCLRLVKRNIIFNCSTRLLRHELTREHAHPLYPYLVDAQTGKLGALKALLVKKARLHFMCESPSEGPHPVQDQKGKVVTIETKEWLTKLARVMLPAFRVICCLLRIAATVYMPSANVFIPSPDALEGLGISQNGLQQVILPKALDALLKGVSDINYENLLTQGAMLKTGEVKEAIQGILKHENIDMQSDFTLHRVSFSNVNSIAGKDAHWVCEKHMLGGAPLKVIANPFK